MLQRDARGALDRQRTPDHLLRTAERLFAQRGIDAVSLRQIVSAASHRNPAAVQYHFGSKSGLIEAIIQHRLEPINQRRLELLEHQGTNRTDELATVMRAVVVPLVELDLNGGHYLRFLAALAARPQEVQQAFDAVDGPEGLSGRLVASRLDAALNDRPPELRRHRILMAMQLVISTLAARQRSLEQGDPQTIDDATATEDLVAAAVGLLSAPPPAAPGRAAPHRSRTSKARA